MDKTIIKNILESDDRQLPLQGLILAKTNIRKHYVLDITEVQEIILNGTFYKYVRPLHKLIQYFYEHKDEFTGRPQYSCAHPLCAIPDNGMCRVHLSPKRRGPYFQVACIEYYTSPFFVNRWFSYTGRLYKENNAELGYSQQTLIDNFNAELRKPYLNYREIKFPFI